MWVNPNLPSSFKITIAPIWPLINETGQDSVKNSNLSAQMN